MLELCSIHNYVFCLMLDKILRLGNWVTNYCECLDRKALCEGANAKSNSVSMYVQ